MLAPCLRFLIRYEIYLWLLIILDLKLTSFLLQKNPEQLTEQIVRANATICRPLLVILILGTILKPYWIEI